MKWLQWELQLVKVLIAVWCSTQWWLRLQPNLFEEVQFMQDTYMYMYILYELFHCSWHSINNWINHSWCDVVGFVILSKRNHRLFHFIQQCRWTFLWCSHLVFNFISMMSDHCYMYIFQVNHIQNGFCWCQNVGCWSRDHSLCWFPWDIQLACCCPLWEVD